MSAMGRVRQNETAALPQPYLPRLLPVGVKEIAAYENAVTNGGSL